MGLKRKHESPTQTSTGNTAVATTLEVNPTTSKENTSDENQPNAPAVSQQPPRKVKGKKKEAQKEESETANPGSSSASASSSSTKPDDLKPPDNTIETEEQFYAKVEVKIKIPDKLKPFLVDDWDYLSRQRKLVNLPSRITVDQVINEYAKVKTAKKPETHKENAILEVTAGLR